MRFSTQRICGDIDYASGNTFVSICRGANKKYFTRNRKMPLPKLLLTMLNRRGTSLAVELRRFRELTDEQETISKPGYLKQRQKLAPEAIVALYDHHNESLYREEDMQTFKGHLILASDGSGINVPTTKETLGKYGSSCNHSVRRKQASLGLSCLYDVINKVILCCSINRVKFDEASQAKSHVARLPSIIGEQSTIVALDRAYPSLPLFREWLSQNQKFVVRLKGTDFKAERKLMQPNDEWCDIAIDKTRLRNYEGTEIYDLLKQAGSLRLRIVNFTLSGGPEAVVATNLSESEFSTEDIVHIYSLRWGVETAFDTLKNNLEIENFTGTMSVLIEQDIFACVYLCNILQDMIADAQACFDSSDKPPGKHKMAINKAYAVGVMKEKLVKALLEPDKDKKSELFLSMIDEIQENVLPVRPGRSYYRNTKGTRSCKYSNTHKRCY